MSEFDFNDQDLLGPAEKHIARQLRGALSDVERECRELLEGLEAIDCDLIEAALLDGDRKEPVIALIEPMQKLTGMLAGAAMMPTIVRVLLTAGNVNII